MMKFTTHLGFAVLAGFACLATASPDAAKTTVALAKSDAGKPGIKPAEPVKVVRPALPRGSSAGDLPGAGQIDPRDAEQVLRLQIFLDRQGFGPGKVDGGLGEFTRKAVDCYNTTIGLPPGDYSAVLRASQGLEVFSSHTVTDSDLSWVDPKLPLKPAEQVKASLMRYRSLAEFAAERYHTDETWLRKANPGLALDTLAAGAEIRVPNVIPFTIESLPRPQQWPADKAFAKRTAVVDTQYKFLCIYEDNRMVGAFPITPGEEKFIRRGTWEVVIMQAWPPFRWDKSMLQTGRRSDEYYMLPPGPNSPVGVFWAGLNRPGIGLHGTATPETIGRARSAGCVRLANWDAVRLPNFLRPGTQVIIR